MPGEPLAVPRRYYDAEVRAIQDGKDVPHAVYADLLWDYATLTERVNCMLEIATRDMAARPPKGEQRGG